MEFWVHGRTPATDASFPPGSNTVLKPLGLAKRLVFASPLARRLEAGRYTIMDFICGLPV